MPTENTQTSTEPVIIEPAAETLTPANPEALAALEAALDPAAVAATPDPAATDEAAGEAATPPDAPAAKEPSATPDADPAAETAKPDADPAAAKAADEAAKRPSDEFGELPKDVPAKTRERFETLRTRFDEVAAERDQHRATAQQWQETVASTGASVEQFGQSLQYLSLVNSGSQDGLRKAYDLLSGELESLGKLIGVEVPGRYDPLSEHADLQAKVESGLLDREDALEIVEARQSRRLGEAQAQRTTQQGADQADLQAKLGEVRAFGQEVTARDPHAAAKLAAITPLVERVIAKLPRDEWMAAIREAYAALPAPAQTPAAAADDKPIPTTMRNTNTPGAGAAKSPGSVMEAVDAALGSLR